MKYHSAASSHYSIRAALPVVMAFLVFHISSHASAADSLQQQMDTGNRLWSEAVKLHLSQDNEGALRKIDEAIEILPPIPNIYHSRAIYLQDLGRYKEALAAFDVAVDIGATQPALLYCFLADRAVVRLLLKDNSGAVEDAKKAKGLAPANSDPAMMNKIARILASANATPLGAIWRLDRILHRSAGDFVEILAVNPDGKTTIHFQRMRKDGTCAQMGVADSAWEGDAATFFGVTRITGNQWRTTISEPKSESIGGSFQISGDGQRMITPVEGLDRDTFTRVATMVESLDEVVPPHRETESPSAAAPASGPKSFDFGKDPQVQRDLPEILKHIQEMGAMPAGK